MSKQTVRTIAAGCAVTLSCCVSVSNAATTIEFMLKQQGLADVAQAAYIQDGKVLIKAAGGDTNMDLLFQQANQTMTIINHEEKSLLDLDPERISALADQASGMIDMLRQQVMAQMGNLSDEQRVQVEKMIENMGGGQLVQPPPPPPGEKTLRQTGVQTVNGFTCSKTEIYESDQKIAEVCSAPADVLGIPAEDFAVIESMRDMSQMLREETAKISSQMGQGVPQFGHAEVDGVPVAMVDASGNTMAITTIQQGTNGVRVEKPAGYAVRQMPTLPQIIQ